MATKMAVSEVLQDIITNIKNDQITCSIFLNLQKTFHTINHNILLLKLQAYSVRDLPLRLPQNYFASSS